MPIHFRRILQLASALVLAGIYFHSHHDEKSADAIIEVSTAQLPTGLTVATDSPPSSASLPTPPPTESEDGAPFAAFNEWTSRFLAAAPSERAALIAEGNQLAKTRRTALAALIPTNPKHALEHAVPMVVRQVLPTEILAQLEERVSARGFFGVLGVVGQPAGGPAIRREVRLGEEKRYEVHTFGSRLRQPTTDNANLSGISIDRTLALDERGFRVLEKGERLDPAKPVFKTCPVSGKSVEVPASENGAPPPIEPKCKS